MHKKQENWLPPKKGQETVLFPSDLTLTPVISWATGTFMHKRKTKICCRYGPSKTRARLFLEGGGLKLIFESLSVKENQIRKKN